MTAKDSVFDQALREEMYRREARSEQVSCLIMTCVFISVFVIVRTTFGGIMEQQITSARIVGVSTVGSLLVLAAVIQFWRWHPVMRFLNTALQVTSISMMMSITAKEQGVEFALSTAAPILYALVISVTAFRLNPFLSLFAGVLTVVEFFAVYAFVMHPMLTPEKIMETPTLGYAAMAIRTIVLLAIGFACALAARSLNRNMVRNVEDAAKVDLLERTFGRYVSPEIAKHVLKNDKFLEARKSEGAVMFVDLKGFTNYSADRSPEDITKLLNRCWEVAAQVVESHGGVINKFLGDGFLALFGVPLELENPEAAAASTAIELQNKIKPILDPEGLSLCIGIHRGKFIAGGVGSESRCEFTVIGTTVNVASRIESLNRELDTNCLASEELTSRIRENFDIQSHGMRNVKGISEPIEVHGLSHKRKSE